MSGSSGSCIRVYVDVLLWEPCAGVVSYVVRIVTLSPVEIFLKRDQCIDHSQRPPPVSADMDEM